MSEITRRGFKVFKKPVTCAKCKKKTKLGVTVGVMQFEQNHLPHLCLKCYQSWGRLYLKNFALGCPAKVWIEEFEKWLGYKWKWRRKETKQPFVFR